MGSPSATPAFRSSQKSNKQTNRKDKIYAATKNLTFEALKSNSMKTRIKNPFLLPALIVGLGLIPAGRVTAQTFTNLHSFTSSRDGATPAAGLVLSGNTLYGTAYSGGSSGNGTVFKVNTDGTGFTNLHNFTGGSGGAEPLLDVILSGNTLYGTPDGGSSGNGTVP